MLARPTFRERLPSALAAIALQGGLLAMLLLSFQVVRHISGEQEHFIALPPLARPVPQPRKTATAPGRKPDAAQPPGPAVPPQLPVYANPGFALGSGGAGAGIRLAQPPGIDACRPENYANLNASDRKACTSQDMARRDPNAMPLNPNKPVKDAPVWQAEIARRNAPPVIPGGNPLGAAATLLFNPGAFLDPRNYSYAAPGNGGELAIDGAESTHQLWSQIPQCPAGLDDTARRTCLANAAAVYRVKFATSGAPGPARPHVSDTDFRKALAATQARQRSLSGRPVLASAPQAGGGNEKSDISGGTGAAAVGGTGSGR